jgi:CDP-diacylglycerol--glycerol-3-phosphate 3-phosphatidyltransferase
VAAGITPNMVSYAGLVCALGSSAALALGAGDTLPWDEGTGAGGKSWWPAIAGVLLGVSALADILDGRLARKGNLQTRFGAVLDSTLDRFGDMAVFVGCALYYAGVGNMTYVLVSCLAMVGSTQVSYVKARGENLVDGLGIGFWQRGERMVAMIIGGLTGRVPTVLWISAVFPLLTVWLRVRRARTLLSEPGGHESSIERFAREFAPWRQPRRSLSYRLLCVLIAGMIVAGPWLEPFFYGTTDPLREFLRAAGR